MPCSAMVGEGPSHHNSDTNDLGLGDGEADELGSTKLQRYWELEQSTTRVQDVQGRLKRQHDFWKDMFQAPVPIIDCISEGYKLHLLSPPPVYSSKNQSLAHQNADFVSSAISELLQSCCVQKICISHIYVAPCWLYPIIWVWSLTYAILINSS